MMIPIQPSLIDNFSKKNEKLLNYVADLQKNKPPKKNEINVRELLEKVYKKRIASYNKQIDMIRSFLENNNSKKFRKKLNKLLSNIQIAESKIERLK